MARTDTLNNFLTDVADSIRAKKGTTNKIPASNFDTEIESIQTGGGEANLQSKSITITSNGTQNITADEGYDGLSDVSVTTNVPISSSSEIPYKVENVNFMDYDGTVLHSYTLDEINSMTDLPDLPTNMEYKAKMWNWTLDEIKEINEPVDVGVIYQYDNDLVAILKVDVSDYIVGNTTYINVSRTNVRVNVSLSIDWGDSNEPQLYTFVGNSSGANITHVYNNIGNYKIIIKLISDDQDVRITPTVYSSNGSYNHSKFFTKHGGGFSSSTYQSAGPWWLAVKEIILGSKCNMPSYNLCYGYKNLEYFRTDDITYKIAYCSFYDCQNLKGSIIPRNTVIGSTSNYNLPSNIYIRCYSMRFVSFPKTISTMSIKNSIFLNNYNIKKIILPDGITSLTGSFAENCYNLEYVYLPDTINSIGEKAFNNCNKLKKIRLSENITSIPNSCFSCCYELKKLNLPPSITSIGTYAFCDSIGGGSGIGITTFDFSKFTQIPTVQTSSFNTHRLKIIVPNNLYDEWITTSNWSTYIDYIVKANEA